MVGGVRLGGGRKGGGGARGAGNCRFAAEVQGSRAAVNSGSSPVPSRTPPFKCTLGKSRHLVIDDSPAVRHKQIVLRSEGSVARPWSSKGIA